jgi:Tfp pilus assembly protein PilN
MFAIDLLNGQGAPARSRPEGIIVAALSTTVPVVAAVVMFGVYVHSKTIVSIKRGQIANYTTKIGALSEAVRLQESLDREKAVVGEKLLEVKSAISRYTQWSSVLAALIERMPESVVLTSLEIKQNPTKKKVPKKNDPKNTVEVMVPITTLRMGICASPQSDSDNAVKDFRDGLRSCPLLGPKIENILVSQELGRLEGRDVVLYEIDCVFKPRL